MPNDRQHQTPSDYRPPSRALPSPTRSGPSCPTRHHVYPRRDRLSDPSQTCPTDRIGPLDPNRSQREAAMKPIFYTQRKLDPKILSHMQKLASLNDAAGIALMPDAHIAGTSCVGTVLATHSYLYPTVIGGDLGCGIRVLRFNTSADAITPAVGKRILQQLGKLIPASHRTHPIPWRLHKTKCSSPAIGHVLNKLGSRQLGTVGGGNHFVELQADNATGDLWAMIHTGSRGFGQAVADWHTQRSPDTTRGLPCIKACTPNGQAFLQDMSTTRAYARLNRQTIASALSYCLSQILGTTRTNGGWDCDHNHVAIETHQGQRLFVHRKGASSAKKNIPLAIPGSMSTFSVHAIGLGQPDAFTSAPHGAGRRWTRTQARRNTTPSMLTQQMAGVIHTSNLHHTAADEAPNAYQDLNTVLKDAKKLVRVIRRLSPVLIHKGK